MLRISTKFASDPLNPLFFGRLPAILNDETAELAGYAQIAACGAVARLRRTVISFGDFYLRQAAARTVCYKRA